MALLMTFDGYVVFVMFGFFSFRCWSLRHSPQHKDHGKHLWKFASPLHPHLPVSWLSGLLQYLTSATAADCTKPQQPPLRAVLTRLQRGHDALSTAENTPAQGTVGLHTSNVSLVVALFCPLPEGVLCVQLPELPTLMCKGGPLQSELRSGESWERVHLCAYGKYFNWLMSEWVIIKLIKLPLSCSTATHPSVTPSLLASLPTTSRHSRCRARR